MSRGELAPWLRRLGDTVETAGVAEPYRLLLEGANEAAADEFHRLSMPYDGALALVDSGDQALSAVRSTSSIGWVLTPSRRRCVAICDREGWRSCLRADDLRRWPTRRD